MTVTQIGATYAEHNKPAQCDGLNYHQVLQHIPGITYRQLDYWTRSGRLTQATHTAPTSSPTKHYGPECSTNSPTNNYYCSVATLMQGLPEDVLLAAVILNDARMFDEKRLDLLKACVVSGRDPVDFARHIVKLNAALREPM